MNALCKGSLALGSACLVCERCENEAMKILQDAAKHLAKTGGQFKAIELLEEHVAQLHNARVNRAHKFRAPGSSRSF